MIPVHEPLLDGNERRYLLECIDTGWISSSGPFIQRFEENFSRRVERKHGIAVANGSAALDIAVRALGLGPGDEVIMPSFTIISPAISVVRAGAIPVLVDSNPLTCSMKIEDIESRITERTKAIIVVHIYGLPVDMHRVLEIARKHNLLTIEDAAEMHGQTCRGKPCGSFGDISIFSFYSNKNMTTGEGGIVLTNNDELAERCRSLRNLCHHPKRRFMHDEMGWNYRMTSMQAALGLAQLEKLDLHVEKKREIGQLYDRLFAGCAAIQRLSAKADYADSIYWVYGLVIEDDHGLDADRAIAALRESGIESRPFFWPLHEQPIFKKMGLFAGEHYPQAERLARRGFYLPTGLNLKPDTIEHIADETKRILAA